MIASADQESFDAVPAFLRELPQWVCWKSVTRKNKGESKPTKMPIDAQTGSEADTTNSATWTTFEEALAAYRSDQRLAGIGIVFTENDPLVGIDVDGCIVDGVVVTSAQAEIDALDSYAEVSPSGTGVKVFIKASKPEWARCRSKAIDGIKEIEVYSKVRFFTVTGRHLAGTPLEVNERQEALGALCEKLWTKEKKSKKAVRTNATEGIADDDKLIEMARGASNGAKFNALWNGDTSNHGNDDSSADLALCSHLAFWSGCDAVQIDRLFRRSGLIRNKWDESRGEQTYGARTIAKAIESCTDTYTPPKPRGSKDAEHQDSDVTGAPQIDDDDPFPLGSRDPATGRLILCQRRTLPTADAFIRDFHSHRDGRTLISHAGALHEWRDNRYVEIDDRTLEQRLQPWLHGALRVRKRNGASVLEDFEANPSTVGQALSTIATRVHVDATLTPPCWLWGSGHDLSARDLLPGRSANLHIPTGLTIPPTPALFIRNALDIDFDANAPKPVKFLRFLHEAFDGDQESIDLLLEWMGYCLVPDTSQQKVLLIVGPKRSGKGTIARVLTRLVGVGNVAGLTTGSLAGPFGLHLLLGCTLGIVSDARFHGRDAATVIERVLCISGEDLVTVDRKFKGALSTKLSTRLMFLSNELPRLLDASAAIASRFLVLRLTKSHYDSEDPTLTEQLIAELPGILNESLKGLHRLRERGHFVQPERGKDAVRELEDLSSPVGAFVRDQCVLGRGRRGYINELWTAWKTYCDECGIPASGKHVFCRDLRTVVNGMGGTLGPRRRDPEPFYDGISLKDEEEA